MIAIKKVAILGASNDMNKFGYKAVKAYLKHGYQIFPINPKEESVQGIKSYKDILDLPKGIDRITFYVPPNVGLQQLEKVKEKGISEVFINPGAESDEIIKKAATLGIKLTLACSILDIGENPKFL